jgi:hypothetical protein
MSIKTFVRTVAQPAWPRFVRATFTSWKKDQWMKHQVIIESIEIWQQGRDGERLYAEKEATSGDKTPWGGGEIVPQRAL